MNGPLNASQIYEQVNGGPGTGRLIAAQEGATGLTSSLSERAQQIADLADKIQAGWTGEAGANAANAALPLAKASLEDAALLAKAGSALEDQTSAFGTVKNTVVPVPPTKPELTSADVFEAVTTGNWNTYNHKVGEWQAKTQQNIDAFAGYHATSMGNGETMPSAFTPLVDPGASVSLAESGGEKSSVPGGGQPNSQPNGPIGGLGGGQPNAVGGSQPHTPAPNAPSTQQPSNPAPQPAPNTTDSTKAAAYNPSTAPKVTPPPAPPATPYVPNNPSVPAPVGAFKTEFGPGTNGRIGTGGQPGGTSGRLGTPGGVGAPGGVPGQVGSGPGRPATPGNPAGRLVGGGPGEMVAARGGASGPAGRPGTPGGAPIGGAAPGGQRGEEDKEHQRPEYLLGPDPDELFGGDREKPVPPVIGETRKPT